MGHTPNKGGSFLACVALSTATMGGITFFRTKCYIHCCRVTKTKSYNTWTDPHSYLGRARAAIVAYLAEFDEPHPSRRGKGARPRPPAPNGGAVMRGPEQETML